MPSRGVFFAVWLVPVLAGLFFSGPIVTLAVGLRLVWFMAMAIRNPASEDLPVGWLAAFVLLGNLAMLAYIVFMPKLEEGAAPEPAPVLARMLEPDDLGPREAAERALMRLRARVERADLPGGAAADILRVVGELEEEVETLVAETAQLTEDRATQASQEEVIAAFEASGESEGVAVAKARADKARAALDERAESLEAAFREVARAARAADADFDPRSHVRTDVLVRDLDRTSAATRQALAKLAAQRRRL
jgi:hypothetical protein